ncbi:MAG: ABC transporter substrate-binding protein [Eubacteriales bacterium]|nr:ABC transporter substrate-binding protein [Eubacteriales bacterium]MDD3109862.1 ABC transporter substrate-binding protein [Eubacteriales bacterium]MDD4133534.1 ABC transporter substrate-binding protein [Eubacteriales bacterium]NLV59027.1 ABC transporter substrate-binding protein [Clostridiales bacterium]
MKKTLALVLSCVMMLAFAAGAMAADGVVKIAVAAPMTGDNAEYGNGFYNATLMAADEVNQAGGLKVGDKTYTVEVLKFDDKSDSDEAQIVAEKIVSDPDIIGVIGHFASGICMVAAPTYNESQYVEISPTASHPDYSGIGEYIFRNNTVITVETKTGVEIAVDDLGAGKIGVLSIDTEWGVSAGNAMEAHIKDMGKEVALRQQVGVDQVDFATEIANFKAAGAEVVMVAGMYGTLAPFAVARDNSEFDVPLVGCSNAYTKSLIEIAGESAEGIYAPVSFFAGNPDPKVQAYVTKYTELYGAAPSALTTQAYDSALILMDAVSRAGSLDRVAIKDAMFTTAFEGISGFTTFDEIGDAQKVFTKIMAKDGDFVVAEFD